MNRSCCLSCFGLVKVIWESRRRDLPCSLELVLGRRRFALVEGRSHCCPFIVIAVEALVDYQRDQECRLTLAVTEEVGPVLEARSCLSRGDLRPFELLELVGSFGVLQ